MAKKGDLKYWNEAGAKDKSEGRVQANPGGIGSLFRHEQACNLPDNLSLEDAQKAYSNAYDAAERPKSEWSLFSDNTPTSSVSTPSSNKSADSSNEEHSSYSSSSSSNYSPSSSSGSTTSVTGETSGAFDFPSLILGLLVLLIFLGMVYSAPSSRKSDTKPIVSPQSVTAPPAVKTKPKTDGPIVTGKTNAEIVIKKPNDGKDASESGSITLKPTAQGLVHDAYTDSVVMSASITYVHNRYAGEYVPVTRIVTRFDNGDTLTLLLPTETNIVVGDRVRIVSINATATEAEFYKLDVK